MTEISPNAEPAVVAKVLLQDLHDIVDLFQRVHQAPRRFVEDVGRWKRRALVELSDVAPEEELKSLARIPYEPSPMSSSSDPMSGIVTAFAKCLESLIADMESHPKRYGRAAFRRIRPPARSQVVAEESAVGVMRLAYPERVTLAWLWGNAPFRFWGYLAGLLFGAFVLGAKLGHIIPWLRTWLD